MALEVCLLDAFA
ncbi:hypothetical protein O1D55_003571 [Vibrio cholerae]|nr:hypothetical protein [Vibrio cholerae]EKE8763191.1 hypothetical protein [Vibrio cholerae]EKF9299263.1 hypothetical protein [Vibrio cholerae]EKF9937360.1 hypothetical protein [Vibrio cholerae]